MSEVKEVSRSPPPEEGPPKKKRKQDLKHSWWQCRIDESNWPVLPDGVCIHQFLLERFESTEAYAFQIETGKKNGRPHFQLTYKVRSRRGTERKKFEDDDFECKWPDISYLEPAFKEEKSWDYCQKRERIPCSCGETGPWVKGKCVGASRDLTEQHFAEFPMSNKPWTKHVLDLVEPEPAVFYNKVHWYWSEHSGAGKNTLQKWLKVTAGAVGVGTSRKHALAHAFKNPSKIYCMNIERERHEKSSLPMRLLEQLSDQDYSSEFGVEATGSVARVASWILVFANCAPTGDFYKSGRVIAHEIVKDGKFPNLFV